MSKRTAVVRFLLPSLAGAFFFLTPIRYDGSLTIPMGIVNDILKDALSAYLSAITTPLFIIAGHLLYD